MKERKTQRKLGMRGYWLNRAKRKKGCAGCVYWMCGECGNELSERFGEKMKGWQGCGVRVWDGRV